jgi:hypothetical protein
MAMSNENLEKNWSYIESSDLKSRLKQTLVSLLPKIFSHTELLYNEDIDKSITKYINRLKLYKNSIVQNQNNQCFFDYIIDYWTEKGRLNSIAFMSHLDNLMDMLYSKIDVKYHDDLNKIFIKVIVTIDNKIQIENPSYLNFIGELLYLDYRLSLDNKLVDIEKLLPNGKSVDFVFEKTKAFPILK